MNAATITTRTVPGANLRRMIEAAITSNFDHCAKAFAENPSTHHWSELQDAMWARQAITSDETMKRALPQMEAASIGSWIDILRVIHEGRAAA